MFSVSSNQRATRGGSVSTAEGYDASVGGSGQGGTPLSRALAEAGLRTGLGERGDGGGTCINEGRAPRKTMEASGRVAYLARRGGDYGVRTGPVSVDLKRVRQRKQAVGGEFWNANQGAVWK